MSQKLIKLTVVDAGKKIFGKQTEVETNDSTAKVLIDKGYCVEKGKTPKDKGAPKDKTLSQMTVEELKSYAAKNCEGFEFKKTVKKEMAAEIREWEKANTKEKPKEEPKVDLEEMDIQALVKYVAENEYEVDVNLDRELLILAIQKIEAEKE